MIKTFLTTALALTIASTSAHASTKIGIGYNIFDLTPAESDATPAFDLGVITGNLEYQPSPYVKGSIFAGFSADESELSKQVDTFRPVTPPGGDIVTVQYRSTAEIDYLAGIELSLVMPTSSHIAFQFDFGYLTSPWESKIVLPFTDTPPAADYEQAMEDQLGDCELTGIEEFCGGIVSEEGKGRISAPYAGASLAWTISERTSIVFSGKKSIGDKKGAFSSFGASLNFSW